MKKSNNVEILIKAKRKNRGVFMIENVLTGFGSSCYSIAFIPFLYEITNYNLLLTGIFVSLFNFMWFLPAPISGKLSDRFGRKKMKIITLPIAILGIVLLFFINHDQSVHLV